MEGRRERRGEWKEEGKDGKEGGGKGGEGEIRFFIIVLLWIFNSVA